MDYPAGFRLPDWEGFKYVIDMGVHRSVGFSAPEQRRIQTYMPHIFQFKFVMPFSDYGAWARWVNDHGFAWFNMPVATHHADPDPCAPLRVRFIDDPKVSSAEAFGFVNIEIQAEHVV